MGSFDRPNLIYRVRPRAQALRQTTEVIGRFPGEAGIVYCISRAEVERTAAALQEQGVHALPYHAGMDDLQRKRNQDAFIDERADVIVATVAFGMGIDKSNVRYVIHIGMPKSLESYQQESGRAGRDGLGAECWLFYSPGDVIAWRKLINHEDPDAQRGAEASLRAMSNFCTSVTCRHQALVGYFGQQLEQSECGACDVCLNELDVVDNATELGQKILSCVVRLKQRFGADHTALVLSGSTDQRVLRYGHNQLSTWGLLADSDRRQVRDWIEQLVAQEYLVKDGEYQTLQVTPAGWELLRGRDTPRLLRPAARRQKKSTARADVSWDGVDSKLFDSLRALRRAQAEQRRVPAYIVFGDAALREMARQRPVTLEAFREVKGVGDKKCADYGDLFVQHIRQFYAAGDPS
jgi:ATP-dependent DNA helicase RecQ